MSYEVVNNGNALTWEEFEDLVKIDSQDYRRCKEQSKGTIQYHTPWIYRGQEDEKYDLLTTYERFLEEELGQSNIKICPYKFYVYMDSIIPALNSLAGTNFSRVNKNELNTMRRGDVLPNYKLLCYARHYGFPSLLLDWTYSYYIAAFFAFYKNTKSKNVSVFAYKEWSGDVRGGWVGSPLLNQMGPYVEAPIRHYRQQATYTSCFAEDGDKILFMNHQDAAESTENFENHKIKKFILKGSERKKVLEMLFSMNINKYTLFDDIDSLMHMLAYKEIVLD